MNQISGCNLSSTGCHKYGSEVNGGVVIKGIDLWLQYGIGIRRSGWSCGLFVFGWGWRICWLTRPW